MTYVIIHSNPETIEQAISQILSKHLNQKILDLEKILQKPDFCIIEQEGKGNIKIEQIKFLQKKLLYSPYSESHQFGIIKEAHLMTTEAQNALLKTLEECHENTTIILIVKNESSVLETILSRCNRIYPKQTNFNEDVENFEEQEDFLQKPIYEKINYIEKILSEKNTNEFLENLILFFRKKHSEDLHSDQNSEKNQLSIKLLNQAKQRISKNVNARIALEYICFKLDEYHNS